VDIINAHVHMIEVEAMLSRYPGTALSSDISVFGEIEASLPLLSPETLICQMDEAGIAMSILYAVEAPIVYASNEYVHRLCAEYADRLLGFASVDPRRGDAADVLDRAVQDLGLKGLKLHPPLQGFRPDDEVVYPVYEKAVELDIPVVFHVGTTPFGSLCRLSQASPLLVDEVAVAFPTLRIMLTHLGTLWHNEAFMVVEKNPNVFIDTAAYLYEIPQLMTPDTVRRVGPDRFVFGTDYPMPYVGRVHRMKDFVETVAGLDLPQPMRDAILGQNVHAFLNGRERDGSAVDLGQILKKAVGGPSAAPAEGPDRDAP